MMAAHLEPRSAMAGVLLLAGFAANACAQSDPVTAGGNGGEGQGGADGGSDVSGPSTTTSGTMCDEQPCKLVAPQCGCDDGYACTVDEAGERVCLSSGTVPPGGSCSANALCEPGSVCVGFGTGETACSAFCETDASCEAPGGKCILPLGATGILLCSQDCDLISSSGCNLAGTSCQTDLTPENEPYTLCAPSGANVAQAICTATSECLPGFACLPTSALDSRCFQWCNVDSPACPVGFSCGALEIAPGVPLVIGSVAFGACNPN